MNICPTNYMRRFFAILPIVFVLAGCYNKEQSDEVIVDPGPTGPVISVPMPTNEILAALGPENNIPLQRLLPDPVFVVVGKPKQFLELPVCAGGEWLVANAIVRGSRLYDIDPKNIERFVQTAGIPLTVFVPVPNPQNPAAMPVSRPIPIPRRTTIITFNTAVDKSLLATSMLGNALDPAVLESLKRTEGKNEYYDLTDPNIGLPLRTVFGMMDERTAVIVEGVEDDIKAVFSESLPKNAVLDRIKRAPVDTNDLTLLTSLEGLNVNPEMLEELLAPISESGYISSSVLQAVQQHLRALSLSLNASAVVGKPIISVYAEGRDEEGTEVMGTAIRGMIAKGQAALIAMNESARQVLPLPPDFALALLNAITVEINGTRINVALNNFETLIPTVNGWIKDQQAVAEKEMLDQDRANQLRTLAEICVEYHTQHGKFPADILDAEGTPLLSWRVALLPLMGPGGTELYNKFKQNEPWNSETNLALSETIPFPFHPITSAVALPKTVIRFFDSPGTPFANKELKIEDLKNPLTTLMFVVVSPEHAVEWTKPEPLAFNIDDIGNTVGDRVLGVTFARQILLTPVPAATDAHYEKWKQDIEAMVKGAPLDPPKPEETQ